MHHFCQWALLLWIHLLQHNIGSHTSHNIAHYNLSEIDISMRQKRRDVCVSKKFLPHSLHIIIFPFPPLKCKISSETCPNSYFIFYEITQCTKFAQALDSIVEKSIWVIHNSCWRLFHPGWGLECAGGSRQQ